MVRTADVGLWSRARACARAGLRTGLHTGLGLLAAAVIGLAAPGVARAEPVKGEASLEAANGYARLVLKFSEDVGTEVTTAGSILLIKFERPADVPIDRWVEAAPDYISGARGDPDGSALRLSLSRKVRVNTMSAGERVFIDLLPDSWTGPPPSLPAEVVKELAERARAAERALRLQRAENAAKRRPPVRVRALVQPTFVRFVFEMPDGVNVSSVLNDQKMTLRFNAPLTFDLADAKIAAPPNVSSITQKMDAAASTVELNVIGDVDVHTFREDKNYNIDVAFQQADAPKDFGAARRLAEIESGRCREGKREAEGGNACQRDHAADLGDDRARDEGGGQAGDGSARREHRGGARSDRVRAAEDPAGGRAESRDGAGRGAARRDRQA